MSKMHKLPAANYDIGYGKPPKENQFEKGQSGNPNGRPKGAKTKRPKAYEERLKNIIYEEAYRTIPVHEEHGVVNMTMAQAVVRSAAVKAAKGDPRSQKAFLGMLNTFEKADFALYREHQDVWITYKGEWEKELARRERLGIDGPDPLPHPDHIKVDFKTGEVVVWGPLTRKSKELFDIMLDLETNINLLEEELAETTGSKRQKVIMDEINIKRSTLKTLYENWEQ